MSDRKIPFRELHPAARVTAVVVLAILAVLAVALLFLLAKWGLHAYAWLWRHA